LSGALLVFAKQPRPGAVKTRFCPPFTAEQAAAFYACLLDDVLETSAAAAARLDLAPILYATPAEACAALAEQAPAGFRTLPQRGPDLAARMESALAESAAAGFAPLLLRGSDSPLLGETTLRAALDALAGADLAICPDLDGGYNLVALRRPAPGLFQHAMSTAAVLEDTLANARRLGLSARLLEPGFDLDAAADLAHLAAARREGRAGDCPRTLAFLDRHGLWP
jgi:rSAM/selenodomain-associated transferase 1